MSLRNRLVLLLGTFGAFAVVVAATTIYAIQWQVDGAVRDFEQKIGKTTEAGRLHVALTEQVLHLRDVAGGCREAVRPYFTARDEFFRRLRQLATFAPGDPDSSHWQVLLASARTFEEASNECLALVDAGKLDEAKVFTADHLERVLVPELDAQLLATRTRLDEARELAAHEVVATSTHTLILTTGVGLLAVGLVVVGAMLIRRWLFVPIEGLQEATRRFSGGELSFRTSPRSEDELGRLGIALNVMAQSVADAQAETRASEEKHRTLFANLRDAVVICDVGGRIAEYHDGETDLLGVDAVEHVGRQLLDVWPEWRSGAVDWLAAISAAVRDGKRYRAVDICLTPSVGGDVGRSVDLQVYRVEFGDASYAAVVLRDVTERHRLQGRIRRAQTMEAVGTMAGGLAHDFSNLLVNVMGTLTGMLSDSAESQYAGRIRSALRACRQAAGLSKRLLSFASSAHGEPQVLCLADTMELIIDSLDPSFFKGIAVQKRLDGSVHARMDPDQFTQTAMNLLRNAKDAMLDGGSLVISVEATTASNPDEVTDESPYAVLAIQDTGIGMTPEVQRRVFEPFFTTKSRAARRGRGMGMAIVYSAVSNAGGFVRIRSQPNDGTTFRVYLPVADGVAETFKPLGDAADIEKSSV